MTTTLLAVACAGSTSEPAKGTGGGGAGAGTGLLGGRGGGNVGDDRLFVPEGLPNTSLDGDETGRLMLVAFTLVEEASGPAFYAAVKNGGQAPSCSAGMLIDFYDKDGQQVTSAGSALQGLRFYRFGTDVVLNCIDPGQIAMTAVTNLPKDLNLASLGSLVHSFPTFGVDDIVPLDGLTVGAVKAVAAKGGGGSYTGKLTNGLGVTVSAPSVSIFPVNRVGRPLGMATSVGTGDLAPQASWTFETGMVSELGADFRAFPAASIPTQP